MWQLSRTLTATLAAVAITAGPASATVTGAAITAGPAATTPTAAAIPAGPTATALAGGAITAGPASAALPAPARPAAPAKRPGALPAAPSDRPTRPAAPPVGWRPDVAAARAYARSRPGVAAFAVRTERRLYGWRVDRGFPSASVLKAMLLVAFLRQGSVRDRDLRGSEKALLAPMIRRSDNAAATTILGRVGDAGLLRLAHAAGMSGFKPASPVWGLSRITARDQTRFFLHIDRFLPPRHRAYGLRLLRTVVPSQRWGIGRLKLPGWRVYFKGGWGSGTGAVDHQVALLVHGDTRLSVAVLTVADGTHAAGKATLEGIFRRLLRDLPETAADTRAEEPAHRVPASRGAPARAAATAARPLPAAADARTAPPARPVIVTRGAAPALAAEWSGYLAPLPQVGRLAGSGGCTGTVVGRALVVTAAHCVAGARRVVFAPGARQSGASSAAPYGVWTATRWWTPAGYRAGDRSLDYALVEIARRGGRAIGDAVGTFSIAYGASPGGQTYVVGYPAAGWFASEGRNGGSQYTCRSTGMASAAGPLLWSACPMNQGASGGPWLVLRADGRWRVAGVASLCESAHACDPWSAALAVARFDARFAAFWNLVAAVRARPSGT
jgi:hypothetical protein